MSATNAESSTYPSSSSSFSSSSEESTPTPTPPSNHASSNEPWALFRAQTDEALDSQAELESTVKKVKHLTTLRDPAEAQDRLADLTATSLEPATKELGDWFDKFADSESSANTAGTREGNFVTGEGGTGYVDRVFQIPELLEQILEPLNVVELLGAMRVNKLLYLTISASTVLRRRMFLDPQPYYEFASYIGAVSTGRSRRRLSRPTFPGLEFKWEVPGPYHLRTVYGRKDGWPIKGSEREEVTVEVQFFVPVKLPRVGKRCRAMLLCMPLVRELELVRSDGVEDESERVFIRDGKGLRVGDVLDAVREFIGQRGLKSVVPERPYWPVGVRARGLISCRADDPNVLAYEEMERGIIRCPGMTPQSRPVMS